VTENAPVIRSILTVDRDLNIRRLIRVNLEADGLNVCEAESQHECLDIIQDQECDLLLLGQELGRDQALDIVSRVRAKMGWAMPVLLVSEDDPSKALLRALEPASYIRKPFDAARLAECVRALLDERNC
jgi:two-component system KDP operon response regulator KdpE